MAGLRKPPGSSFAYASALVVAIGLIGGGGGAAIWFRTHLGAPPPIVVVAQAPAVTTSAVPTTRMTTTTTPPPPVFRNETVPPRLPDAAAYTGAVPSALPGFENKSANNYGWFGGDGVSARCDEWNRATVVGSTVNTLFVVCGSYFKAYELATGTPIRTGMAGGGGAWSGAGGGVSIQLTRAALTLARDGGEAEVQPVVEWWAA
ncbi:hypothetical protein JMUB6875_07240 [Nocardia sp. JMUB6875]|uniref:hypothetical protein n=1 Tax=Nocardia sp. JMUB6875 TaxID=3158170 RepID=UPI0032E72DF1